MKRISYYLGIIVLVGISIVSFWVYQKYFKAEQTSVIAFQVTRGDLREVVNVRGEVAPQKEFDLEFPFGGTVERVYVKEGEEVKSGDPLMKLETRELEIERAKLLSVVAQSEAVLKNLLAGAKEEDVSVSQARVASARLALIDAEKTLLDANLTAYTHADDVIHNTADQFFDNARTSNPSLNLVVNDTQIKTNLNADRAAIEVALKKWKGTLPTDTHAITEYTATTKAELGVVKTFLQDLAFAVNSMSPSALVSQATIDARKLSVSTARATIDTSITTITSSEEKINTNDSAFMLAQSELALKQSKPRSTDIVIAEAQVNQNKGTLALTDEKIRKSTLYAPGTGVVKKLMLEEKEISSPGKTALIFASSAYKIQADVSELDISKVRYVNGSDADIRFDSFPGKVFTGKVVFIEPKEIIKNEDVYFRTNIFLEPRSGEERILSGMSADVILHGVFKKNVLMIPELAVEKRGGTSFVKVALNAKTKEEVNPNNLTERVVTTGISDGESVEVLTGLTDGEVVVVSAD